MKSTFSIITKEEDLQSLNHHIIPNTLVLEIIHPFPGYYFGSSFIQSDSQPQTILIVLKKEVDFEYFYRKLGIIQKKSEFNFGAELAEITFNSSKMQAIRINSLEKFEQIISLQNYFIENGFVFRKSQKISGKAIIKVNKFINLDYYSDGIYYSVDNSHFIYLSISKKVSWIDFEKITLSIRHNFDKKFDAALGLFIYSGNVEDVIRIYSKELEKEDVARLKMLYNREII
jgi:hypothetical protein